MVVRHDDSERGLVNCCCCILFVVFVFLMLMDGEIERRRDNTTYDSHGSHGSHYS